MSSPLTGLSRLWFHNRIAGCACIPCLHVVNVKTTTWVIVCALLFCAAAASKTTTAESEELAQLGQCCPAASDPSLDVQSAGSSPAGAPPPMRMAFIIGAMKAGTTFLFDELVKRHPAIMARAVNERREHMVSAWIPSPPGLQQPVREKCVNGSLPCLPTCLYCLYCLPHAKHKNYQSVLLLECS